MSRTTQLTPLRLQALYEVSHQINSELDLDRLLDAIIDRAIDLLRAEKGLVLLRNPASGELDVRVARGMDRNTLSDAVVMSRTVIEKVEKDGESVLLQKIPDIPAEDTSKSMVAFRLKSIVSVPLRTRDELIGAIYLDTARSEHFFKEDDLHFLEAFANLAGIAIDNARRYTEIETLNATLEAKVERRTAELRAKHAELSEAYDELRAAQLQLIRSEKMASLGHLVAGVAHEVNTPLGALTANMDLFVRAAAKVAAQLDAAGQDPAALAGAMKAAGMLDTLAASSKTACGRISTIVKALRNFARLDEEDFKPVDIHEGLRSMLVLMEGHTAERITVETDFADLPRLPCQAAQINQVFMSLFANACDAIDGEGTIRITTALRDGAIEVRFADTGRGIPGDSLERIFDPGYTTKGVGVGVGLGLAIAYRIVRDHRGDIAVESEVGKGSVFTVRLPVGRA